MREALKRLAEDRLVDLVPHSGCYVCELTHEEARDILEIRKRLELLALEYAFDRFDKAKLENLRNDFKKCLELNKAKFVKKELQLDAKLHSLICETSNSQDLQFFLNKLWARIKVFRVQKTTDPEVALLALKSHVRIINAIITGDRERSLKLLTEHIDHVKKLTLNKV